MNTMQKVVYTVGVIVVVNVATSLLTMGVGKIRKTLKERSEKVEA